MIEKYDRTYFKVLKIDAKGQFLMHLGGLWPNLGRPGDVFDAFWDPLGDPLYGPWGVFGDLLEALGGLEGGLGRPWGGLGGWKRKSIKNGVKMYPPFGHQMR